MKDTPKINKEQVVGVAVGVVIAYAITATVFIATAIGITYTNLQESSLPTIVVITCFISVLVAGFDSAKKAGSKGWVWGVAAGLAYAIVLLIIIIWINGGFVMDGRKILVLLVSIVGGGIGGALGINFKR